MTIKSEKEWEVYIVQTHSGKLYTGITTDLERRFFEHDGKPQGAKFFRTSRPEKVVFREKHKNRSLAAIREAAIKQMTRAQKQQLIQKQAP